jgi:hypothetical protein
LEVYRTGDMENLNLDNQTLNVIIDNSTNTFTSSGGETYNEYITTNDFFRLNSTDSLGFYLKFSCNSFNLPSNSFRSEGSATIESIVISTITLE